MIMNKPWDLKKSDERVIDNVYSFLIFCEDETSEVEYLTWFETNLIKINVVPKQRSMTTNVIKAITHCKTHGIIDEFNGVVDGYEVWCVYDRDKYEINQLEDNTAFDIAHQVAELHKINLAWSNDSFELWILLHLFEVDFTNREYFKREKYYDILTDYFKNHLNPNERLVKVLSHHTYNYKKDLKRRKNFIEIVLKEILPNTNIAIDRAKKLLDVFQQSGNTTYNSWIPCTLMHLLVIRLLTEGTKPIPLN